MTTEAPIQWAITRLPLGPGPSNACNVIRALACQLALKHHYRLDVFRILSLVYVPENLITDEWREIRAKASPAGIALVQETMHETVWLTMNRDGQLAAFALYSRGESEKQADLDHFFVVPEWRNHPFAPHQLLKAFQTQAGLDGFTDLHIQCDATVAEMRYFMDRIPVRVPPFSTAVVDEDGTIIRIPTNHVDTLRAMNAALGHYGIAQHITEVEQAARDGILAAATLNAFLLRCDPADPRSQAEFIARFGHMLCGPKITLRAIVAQLSNEQAAATA